MPDNQDITYAVTTCDAGVCATANVPGIDQRFGDRLAADVSNANGTGCVAIESATDIPSVARASDAGALSLTAVGAPICVSAPLVRIGLAVSNADTEPAFFFRVRESDDGAAEQALRASDFEAVSAPVTPASQEPDVPAPASIVDASSP